MQAFFRIWLEIMLTGWFAFAKASGGRPAFAKASAVGVGLATLILE
jgi:hypothetical protein